MDISRGSVLIAQSKMKRYSEQMKNNDWMLWYSSHYPEIDKYTSWLIPWKVYTIAGYSNTGKSRFVYWYVNHVLNMWKKVIFISLEVDKGLLFQHLCCNRYNVYNRGLKDENIDITDFANLLIFDDIYNIDEIEELILSEKPDMCVIDFIQNIQVTMMSWYEAMAMVARKLQEIAIRSNTIMMDLSQISNDTARELSKGNTSFITLKGAWEFIASSDVVILLSMMDWDMMVTIAKTKFASKPEESLLYKTDFGRSKFHYIKSWF